MATLDDIPTLPSAASKLSLTDLIGLIDTGDLRSPKKATFAEVFSYLLSTQISDTGALYVNNGVTVDGVLSADGGVRFPSYSVSTLPSAATHALERAFVVDCESALSSSTIGLTGFNGGGSNTVPVYSNGIDWVIG